MALNSPFGLATKPDNTSYLGSILGVTTKLLTIDANPTIAYKIAPGVTIGAGVQIMWAQGKLQFNENPFGSSVAQFLAEPTGHSVAPQASCSSLLVVRRSALDIVRD